MISLIYLISSLVCLILLSRRQILDKLYRKSKERQFEALLSQKILEPNSETIKSIDLPYFSLFFNEILELKRKYGLDIRKALKKLRSHFRLFKKFSRAVYGQTTSQFIQLVFLCGFIGIYSYFVTQFFPSLSLVRVNVLFFNIIGTLCLLILTSFLHFILFSRVWVILFSLFKVQLQLELGLSINEITSNTPQCFKFDKKLLKITERRDFLFKLLCSQGESINEEVNFLLEELLSFLELRILFFGKVLDTFKLLLLAIFFLPSIFFLNFQMMKSALGQVL